MVDLILWRSALATWIVLSKDSHELGFLTFLHRKRRKFVGSQELSRLPQGLLNSSEEEFIISVFIMARDSYKESISKNDAEPK